MIEEKMYTNIVELYNTQPDFKEAFDEDKNRSNDVEGLECYMDDYSDRSGIVEGVLADTIGDKYKYSVSRHSDWRDKRITIIKK